MTTAPDPATEDGYAWVQRVTLAVDGIPFALRGFRDAPQYVILPGRVWRKRHPRRKRKPPVRPTP